MILFVGGLLYAILCLPAVFQRGFPPIDPAWEAIPHLWILPLILSAIVDRAPARIRLRWILIYSYFTACFVAGSFTFMVPRMMSPEAMLFGGLMVAPFHILVASVLEFVLEKLRKVAHYLLEHHARLRLIAKSCLALVILGGTVAAPLVWRQHVFTSQRLAGQRAADDDWLKKQAVVLQPLHSSDRHQFIENARIKNDFDSKTGFRVDTPFEFFGYAEAYNDRIEKLIEQQGIPDWSMKAHLISNEELISLFNADGFKPISEPSHRLTPFVVVRLTDGAGKPKQGEPEIYDSLDFQIERHPGLSAYEPSQLRIGVGAARPISTMQSLRDPRVTFVRVGKRSVYVFYETGLLLASADG